MDALKIIAAAAALALVAPSPARADPLDRWRAHIAEASARFGAPVAWIERVMRAESGGMILGRRPITSHAGAMGLMQLMPGTWAEMRRRLALGHDPHAPRDNILAGTFYLRLMYDRFGYPGAFAAYNAGPARYAAHLATGRALPGETRAYLAAVVRPDVPARPAGALVLAPERPGLFFALRPAPPPRRGVAAPTPSLFVPLSGGRGGE